MASKAILTSRELKNKVTGIDLMVPEFTEKAGKFSKSAVFNVYVITRLFYFKSRSHKESDIVQFMVQKTYEQFETLHEKLSSRFPSVLFPTLPKRSLVVNSAILQERRRVLDELMHLVARTQKLCCSPMLLEFLGVRGPEKSTHQTIVISEEIFNEQTTAEVESSPEQQLSKDQEDGGNSDEKVEKEEQSDLFVPVDLDASHVSDIASQDDIFAASNSKKLELHASLFEDEVENVVEKDETDLFMPADASVDLQRNVETDEIDNTDDLLTVEENVDDLLALSKKSERKSSIKASASTRPMVKPKTQSRTSFESSPDNEDLTLLSSSKNGKGKQQEEDFFSEARTKTKTSLREKRDKLVKEDTLDDIFGKGAGSKNLFAKSNVDDDLFTASPIAASNAGSSMQEDDISKYINDNINKDLADLDL